MSGECSDTLESVFHQFCRDALAVFALYT